MQIKAGENEIKENEFQRKTRIQQFKKKSESKLDTKNKNKTLQWLPNLKLSIPEFDYEWDNDTKEEDEEIRIDVRRMIEDAKEVYKTFFKFHRKMKCH